MTVGELKKALRRYKDDCIVYRVTDWNEVDENGALTDLSKLTDVTHQIEYVDRGMDFEDVTEVLLEFEND